MTFDKPPLSLSELVRHLQRKGLDGDPVLIARRLDVVGYYRLSPYWRQASDPTTGLLRPGTTIEQVWRLYTFDRELRLLALDAIERVEVAARARLVQAQVLDSGPFGYAAPVTGRRPSTHYVRLLDRLRADLVYARQEPEASSVTEPMRHFAQKYGPAHDLPPLWLAAEGFTFGDLVTLYRGSPRQVRLTVARSFGLYEPVLDSWLSTLQAVRNICAHHGRLWNRQLGLTPRRDDRDPRWADPVLGPPNRIFYAMTILASFMGLLSDGSSWASRFKALVERRYPDVPRADMGLREGWASHPIWAERLREGA